MSVRAEIEDAAASIINAIEGSLMPPEEKVRRVKLVSSCKNATNGYSPEEKMQIISENNFSMAEISCFDKIDSLEFRKTMKEKLQQLQDETREQIKKVESNQDDMKTSIHNNEVERKKDTDTLISMVQSVAEKIDSKLEPVSQDLNENNKLTNELKGKVEALEKVPGAHGSLKSQPKFWSSLFNFIIAVKWQITIIVVAAMGLASFSKELKELFSAIIDKF